MSAEVTEILDRCRIDGVRITLSYAGSDGVDWLEECDITGTVGVSRGPTRALILLANSRSTGGAAISVGSVARIREASGGRELYRRRGYRQPTVTIRRGTEAGLPIEVWNGESIHARLKTEKAMLAWARRLGIEVIVYARDAVDA